MLDNISFMMCHKENKSGAYSDKKRQKSTKKY